MPKVSIICEHFSGYSNKLHSGKLSTSSGTAPLVARSRRMIRFLVVRPVEVNHLELWGPVLGLIVMWSGTSFSVPSC